MFSFFRGKPLPRRGVKTATPASGPENAADFRNMAGSEDF